MFDVVQTPEQLQAFNELWKQNEGWKGKGYETNDFDGKAFRALLKESKPLENGSPSYFGTFEAINHNPDPNNLSLTSNVEDVYTFSDLPVIRDNRDCVGEIDKLTILKEKSGLRNLRIALTSVMRYSELYDKKILVATIEPRLFEIMKDTFHIDMYSPTNGPIEHNGYFTTPAVIFAEEFSKKKHQYKWVIKEKSVV